MQHNWNSVNMDALYQCAMAFGRTVIIQLSENHYYSCFQLFFDKSTSCSTIIVFSLKPLPLHSSNTSDGDTMYNESCSVQDLSPNVQQD